MGAPTELNNLEVARTFTHIYYQVASTDPHELCLLYDDDSSLLHDGITALGTEQIKLLTPKLPVVRNSAALFSVDVQQMASGGLVVVALGTVADKLFSQTFLLERKSESFKAFYCRNDVFRLLPDDPAAAVNAYVPVSLDLHNVQRVPAPEPTANKPALASSSPQTVVVDAPPAAVVEPDPAAASALPSSDPVDPSDLQSVSENKALPADPPVEAPAPLSATDSKDDLSEASNSSASATEEHAPADPPAKEQRPPAPVVPKTWASIVSAQRAAPGPPSAASPASERAPPMATSPAKAAPADPTPDKSPGGSAAHYARKTEAARKAPPGAPKPKPYHDSYNGFAYKPGPKFGPSAVVQLSSVGASWLADTKSLAIALREEFANYGHRVRHVEVKQLRGIAFVEYDSFEGVAAAVAAWADGPRSASKFGNVALAVSEKRNMRRPGSARGRGPPPRGRRGPRPTSSPAPS